MGDESHRSEDGVLFTVRRLLAGALFVGSIGSGAELVLLGHFETAAQFIPLVLLAAGVCILTWQVAAPTATRVRALQGMMVLFLVSGVVGIGLHYDGNTVFELEMYPSLGGLQLVRRALTGATPVLAPGTMALLGVIGWAYTHGHPCLTERGGSQSSKEEGT